MRLSPFRARQSTAGAFAGGHASTAALLLAALLTACASAPPAASSSASSSDSSSASASGSGALVNVGRAKVAALQYQRSGAYARDFAAVATQARLYIEQRASQVSRPAIVLDIDETSLSNWPQIAANDFGYIPDGSCDALPKGPCGSRAWELSSRAAVLEPTLALFQSARAHNVTVFFITGRDESERSATEENLRRAGYSGWAEVILRPAGSHTASAADYKAPQRARIAAQGYTIIANMGDQESDLAGGYAERGFLLPNPYYYIP